jgi:hypothetical protein
VNVRSSLLRGELLNVAETARKGALGFIVQVLTGEYQYAILQEGRVNLGPGFIAKFGQINIGYDCTKRCVDCGDCDCHLPASALRANFIMGFESISTASREARSYQPEMIVSVSVLIRNRC